MVHFLQSTAWGEFQKHLGRTVINDSGDGWSYLAVIESGVGNSRIYTPYGPYASDEKALNEAVSSLVSAAKRHGATFVRIEPFEPFDKDQLSGWKLKSVSYQQLNPQFTQLIDVNQSPESILAKMSQNSRNITRNYKNKSLEIHSSRNPDDIQILTTLLKGVVSRNHIRVHSDSYFRAQAESLFPLGAATLYYATVGKKPVAAALIYQSDTTWYYAHAAADDEYRKLSAGTALLGQIILDANSGGARYVDLYGVAPPDSPADHPWAGFTRFKQSFGGETVRLGGTWDIPIKRLPYWLYRTYQSISHKLR